jgi:tRNA-dihydrouridine synthase
MLRAGDEAGSEFYEVVAFGRETERSINLFEAADRMQTGVNGGDIPELDNLVNGMEDYVREQVSQGQLDSVRKRLQGMLDSLEGKVRPAKKSEKPEKPETPETPE